VGTGEVEELPAGVGVAAEAPTVNLAVTELPDESVTVTSYEPSVVPAGIVNCP